MFSPANRELKLSHREVKMYHTVYQKMNQDKLIEEISKMQDSCNIDVRTIESSQRKYVEDQIELLKQQLQIARMYVR